VDWVDLENPTSLVLNPALARKWDGPVVNPSLESKVLSGLPSPFSFGSLEKGKRQTQAMCLENF
jgi:hypothetical protein